MKQLFLFGVLTVCVVAAVDNAITPDGVQSQPQQCDRSCSSLFTDEEERVICGRGCSFFTIGLILAGKARAVIAVPGIEDLSTVAAEKCGQACMNAYDDASEARQSSVCVQGCESGRDYVLGRIQTDDFNPEPTPPFDFKKFMAFINPEMNQQAVTPGLGNEVLPGPKVAELGPVDRVVFNNAIENVKSIDKIMSEVDEDIKRMFADASMTDDHGLVDRGRKSMAKFLNSLKPDENSKNSPIAHSFFRLVILTPRGSEGVERTERFLLGGDAQPGPVEADRDVDNIMFVKPHGSYGREGLMTINQTETISWIDCRGGIPRSLLCLSVFLFALVFTCLCCSSSRSKSGKWRGQPKLALITTEKDIPETIIAAEPNMPAVHLAKAREAGELA